MTEEQADTIIQLLERIVSNTDDTRRAVERLHSVNDLNDVCSKLDEVREAIERLELSQNS